MIGSLRGVLADRPAPGEVIVDVGGWATGSRCRPRWWPASGAPGSEVFLHVHTHVREDAIVLFGFAHADERRCFEALLGAHGVGPSLALAILSSLSPAALSTAVLEDDVDTLCLVPGVGKKTAARLLLELKARLDLPSLGGDRAGRWLGGLAPGRGPGRPGRAGLRAPTRSAPPSRRSTTTASVEDMVRTALRELARNR